MILYNDEKLNNCSHGIFKSDVGNVYMITTDYFEIGFILEDENSLKFVSGAIYGEEIDNFQINLNFVNKNDYLKLLIHLKDDEGKGIDIKFIVLFKKSDVYESYNDYLETLDNKLYLKVIGEQLRLKSFCQYNQFIMDYSGYFAGIIENIEGFLEDYEMVDYNTKVELDRTIELSRDFFLQMAPDFNFYELFVRGQVSFRNNDDKSLGVCYYDELEKTYKIDLRLYNTIIDSLVLTHEIMHYRNSNVNNNQESFNNITEILSNGYELIMAYNLLDTKYKKDILNHFRSHIKTLYDIANKTFPFLVLQAYYLQHETLDVRDEDDYDLFMSFVNYVKELSVERSASENFQHFTGFLGGIFLLLEYIKDDKFIERIEYVNKNINNLTTEEAYIALNIDLDRSKEVILEFKELYEGKKR